jgi:predicted double-glycine peptidase
MSLTTTTRRTGARGAVAIAVALSGLLLAGVGASQAGSFNGRVGSARLDVGVTSMREQKFAGVVEQKYDFSCGSAALATLLTHHYEDPTAEKPIFKSMLEHGDREKIRKRGFSLLDMKKYLARQGYKSNGFRVPLTKLTEVGIPAVALINVGGYRHFVVIKGLTEEKVLVGDPSSGMKIYPRSGFTEIWNGLLFVITNKAKLAKASFNQERAWRVDPSAPLGQAVTRKVLRNVRFNLPGPNEF